MAINSSPSTLSTVDEIILAAYKRAGLLPLEFEIGADSQWNAKAAHGRTTMNRVINGLAVHGLIENFHTFFVQDLVAGTPSYTISSSENAVNVLGNGSYIPVSNGSEELETDGETPVKPITFHRWNELSAKAASGTPTLYYLHRNGPDLTVYLWPVPSEAGKVRFKIQRIPGSNSTGSDNPDIERHFDSWLVNALAYELMSDSKLPLDERLECAKERDHQLQLLKSYESSNEGPDVVFYHSTPWSSWGN